MFCSVRRRDVVRCFFQATPVCVGFAWQLFPLVVRGCCSCAVSGNLFVSARCKCISESSCCRRRTVRRHALGWYGTCEVQSSSRCNGATVCEEGLAYMQHLLSHFDPVEATLTRASPVSVDCGNSDHKSIASCRCRQQHCH